MRRSRLVVTLLLWAACSVGLMAQNAQPPAEAELTGATESGVEENAEVQDQEQQVPAEPEEPAAPDSVPTTVDASPDWQLELDQITDLLIDGKPQEAKEKAELLLAVENLPEDIAARARTLRDKADAKLAGSRPVVSTPRPKIEIPAKAEDSEKTKKSETPLKEQSFKVRMAAIGSGFSQGMTGLLLISETGISFVPQGKNREDWAIRWKDLVEARSDTGLWDVPYPLVLIERGGRKRYVARLDQKGNYLPGAPLLSAIAEARRAQKASPPKQTTEPKEGR